MKRLSTLSLALIAFTGAAQLAQALPRNANGTVINGTASIVDTSGTVTTINQSSDIAEINWSNFDIASGQTVQFNVPRAESVTINRVTSGLQSTIAGTINSNGQVYLINEHGLNFTNGAQFNMPTFVASTIDTFNAEADAAQYAEITFDAVSNSGATNFVVLSPFIAFDGGAIGHRYKQIISANRATVSFTGADNTLLVDVPDTQPDVVVPMGKTLGIDVSNGANLTGDRLKMIAKAHSVQQSIDALINLNHTNLYQNDVVGFNPVQADYALDIQTSGHLMMAGNVALGLPYVKTNSYLPNSTRRLSDVRLMAGKNLFMEQFGQGVDDIYIEAGHNLILNSGDLTTGMFVIRGIFGQRTIKLGTGTMSVEANDYDFTGLGDIASYAPGTIGHVADYWVAKQDYTKPVDSSSDRYYGPDGNIALDTYLEAEQIDINTAIDLTGAVTEQDFKENWSADWYWCFSGCSWITGHYFVDNTGQGDNTTAHLNLNATGDVNINANIDMAGMGDINVTAVNYNINGGSTVANASNENFVALPPPPTPPAPEPDPVVPPVVDTPTFEELMTETLTPERIELVKEVFFESFSEGAKEVVAQISNVEPVAESKQSVPAAKRAEFVGKQELAENVDPTAVAAACADGICTVLDKNDSLQIVEESYLNRYKEGLQNIVDKVVNLKGITDITRF